MKSKLLYAFVAVTMLLGFLPAYIAQASSESTIDFDCRVDASGFGSWMFDQDATPYAYNAGAGVYAYLNLVWNPNGTGNGSYNSGGSGQASFGTCTAENTSMLQNTQNVTIEFNGFALSSIQKKNWGILGQSGDYRVYTGGTATIKVGGVTKLATTNCRISMDVNWPSPVGPGSSIFGSGWGTIDPSSDDAWEAEFNTGNGQVEFVFSSFSPVVQDYYGAFASHLIVKGAPHREDLQILPITSTGGVNFLQTGVALNVASFVKGGFYQDLNSFMVKRVVANPGGALPPIIPACYWELGTVLDSINASVTFDLTGIPGISNPNLLRILKRQDIEHAWTVINDYTLVDATHIRANNLTSFGQFVLGVIPEIPQMQWQKTFGGAYGEAGYSVQQTADGGYIIVGYTSSFGAGNGDVYLIKTDASGNMTWSQTFGGANNDQGYSVQPTADGGYIIAGSTNSSGAGGNDVYLIKTNSSGNMTWSQTFGGANNDQGYSVQPTADGGYIIGGTTYSFGAGNRDVYLIKTDASGNMTWQKTFGGANEDYGNSAQPTADGGYIVGGWTYSFGAGNRDMYLIKTDSSGNMTWSKTFGGANDDGSSSVQPTADGGYIISGWTYSFGAGSADVYLIKTDASGNLTWSQTFGGASLEDGYSVQLTANGGYIIAGITLSFGAGSNDVYLIKTDASGNMTWSQTFGGTSEDWSYSVRPTSDGGYIIAGQTSSFGAGGTDVYLIKLAPLTAPKTIHVPGDYSTIQAAIDAATANDTVLVAAGIYNEDITLKDGVNLQGAGAGVTTINGTGAASFAVQANSLSLPTVMDGFTIRASGGTMKGGININSSSPFVLSHCTVTGTGGTMYVEGVKVSSCSPKIEHCTITGNGGNPGAGLAVDHGSPTIVNSVIKNNQHGIMGWWGGSPVIVNSIIRNNGVWGMVLDYDSTATIINCTIYGNGYNGIYDVNLPASTVTNSIIWNNPGGPYQCQATYSDIEGGGAGVGNISLDPLFVNAAAGNFHLQPNSPCIDAGNNTAVPGWLTKDFDGDPRIMDGNGDTVTVVDIGADEAPALATPPTVISKSPTANATNVAVNTTITATFDKAMNASTINTSSFTVVTSSTPIPGAVSYDSGNKTAMFIPSANLSYSTNYTAILSTAITDTNGNPLASAVSWSFTTLSPSAPPPFLLKWGGLGWGSGDGQFNFPMGVAVDASGNVYVADYNNHRIQKFTSSGAFITKWGEYGGGDGQFNEPAGVAVDASGNVYVADNYNQRIQKFNSSGTFITQWGSFGYEGNGQFAYPGGIAVDSTGNVYVADTAGNRIQKFTSSGVFITQWGIYGSGDGQFNIPSGVAVDASGNVYVAERDNHRIQKFTSSGVFITKWGGLGWGSGDGQFNQPPRVAVDASGNVYVADCNNHRIQKFTSSGVFITKWGSYGQDDGRFYNPMGVAVDASGNVYVADANNNRIQVFGAPVSPAVTSKSPTDNATNVAVNTPITATFDKAMNASTINISSFTVVTSSTPIPGAVSYDSGNKTATFIPSANLSYSTNYTAILSTAITDTNGNPLASAVSWSFITVPPTTPVTPGAGADFSPGPLMNIARIGHASVTLPDGRVVVFGGHGTGFTSLNTAEVWATSNSSFTTLTMKATHDWAAIAKLTDGRYLITGGAQDLGVAPGYNTAEIFNPTDNSFTTTGSMTYARMNHAAARLSSGKVLVVGGWYDSGSSTYGDLYNPSSGTFNATGALNTPRANPMVLPTTDGKAVVFGGWNAYGPPYYEQVELYDPATNSFSVLQSSLFSGDTGWYVNYNCSRPIGQLADGRYLLLAFKPGASVTQFTLFTFDPATKQFAKVTTTPALPDSSAVWLISPVVDQGRGKAYLLAIVSESNPQQLRLYTADLSGWQLYAPTGSYTLPASYYLDSNLGLLADGRVFITGGSSVNDITFNFNPIRNTLFAIPNYYFGPILPTATFSPTSGAVGTMVTVNGTGWAASENISSVTVGGVVATNTLTVNGSGTLSGTITVPSVSNGVKDIVITGSNSGAQTFPGAFIVSGMNVIRNGDFSSGLDNWIINPTIPSSWNPLSGGGVDLHPSTMGEFIGVILYQNLNVGGIGGKTFNLSMNLTKLYSPASGKTVAVYVTYVDTSNNTQTQKILNPNNSDITENTLVSANYTFPSSARKLVKISFAAEYYGEFIADNISFTSNGITVGPVPIISSVTGTGTYGSTATISGSNFGTTAGTVLIDGSPAGVTVNNWTNTSIVVGIAEPARSGRVCVITDYVESNIDKTFKVTSPNFTVDIPNDYLTVVKGQTVTIPIRVDFHNGFTTSSGINFQISSGNSSLNALFTPVPLKNSGGVALKIDTSSLAAGTYQLTVQTIESSSLARTATSTLNVVTTSDIKFYEYDASYNKIYITTDKSVSKQGSLSIYTEGFDSDGNPLTAPITLQSDNPSILGVYKSNFMGYYIYALQTGSAKLIASAPDGFTKYITVNITVPGDPAITSISLTPSQITNKYADNLTFLATGTRPIGWEILGMWSDQITDSTMDWSNDYKTYGGTFKIDASNPPDLGTYLFGAVIMDSDQSTRLAEAVTPLTIVDDPSYSGISGGVIAIDPSLQEYQTENFKLEFYQGGSLQFSRNIFMNPHEATPGFELGSIPPGTYKIKYVPFVSTVGPSIKPQWYPNADNISGASDVTLQAGQVTQNIYFFAMSAPALTSIAVTPFNPTIALGQTQQFTANGTYADNSTANITNDVFWYSSNPSVATINTTGQANPGLATGVAVGTTNITAWLGMITSTPPVTLTVALVGAVDHVVLSPSIANITADGTQAYTVEAFDGYGNSWDVTAGTTFAITSGAGGSWAANVYTANKVGTWTVTATHTPSGKIATAILIVTPGAITYILLSPSTASITTAETQVYTVTAYDVYGNSANKTAYCTFSINTTAGGSWTNNVYTPQNVGTWTVTATHTASGKTATATLTVFSGVVDHIVLSPSTACITADSTQAYTVTAFNAFGGSWNATPGTTFTINATAGGSWTNNVYTAGKVGTWTVTATHTSSGKTATASLMVTVGALHHIVLSPSTTTIIAGNNQTYAVEAFDQRNNTRGNVTAGTTFSINTTAGGSWTNNVYTSEKVGIWTITGNHTPSGKTATATLTVIKGTTVEVNNGNTITLGAGGTITASGTSGVPVAVKGLPNLGAPANGLASFSFDFSWDKNVIRVDSIKKSTDAAALDWTITVPSAPYTTGTVAVVGYTTTYSTADIILLYFGITAVGTAGNSTSINVTITALRDKDNVPIPATPINAPVVIPQLVSIAVTPTPASIALGQTQQFTATGTYTAGPTLDITSAVTWASSNTSVATINTTGQANPGRAIGVAKGTTVITASLVDPVTGLKTSPGVTLTVTAGAVDHIVLSPSTATITADGTQAYTVTAFDAFGVSWGVTANTTFAIVEAGHGGSWTNNVYTPKNVGTWTVTATHTPSGKTATATLTVTAGAVDHIVLSPSTATITTGDKQTYTVEAYDAAAQHWDVTAETIFSINATAGGSWTANVYTPKNVGTWTVTATHTPSGKTATATLTVIKGTTVEVNQGNMITLATGGNIIASATSGIPIAVKGLPNLGAPANGLACFTFNFSWDKNVIRVDSIKKSAEAADWDSITIPPSSSYNSTGTVTVSGFTTTFSTNDIILLYFGITAVGNAGSSTSVNVTITTLYDKDNVTIPATPVNAPVQIASLMAETSIAQAKDSDGIMVVRVNIDRIKDLSGNTAAIPGGIGSYTAVATANSSDIKFITVRGVPPFANPTFDNVTGIFSATTNATPAQASTVAAVVPILTGNTTTRVSLTAAFQVIGAAGEPGLRVYEEHPNTITFQRGDTSGDGKVDIGDASWIAQYVVGMRTLDQINGLNAASVSHGTGGDKIDIGDASWIAQYIVGMRDAYFQPK